MNPDFCIVNAPTLGAVMSEVQWKMKDGFVVGLGESGLIWLKPNGHGGLGPKWIRWFSLTKEEREYVFSADVEFTPIKELGIYALLKIPVEVPS